MSGPSAPLSPPRVERATGSGLSAHILPTSATLVGACITAISVVKFAHVGTAGAFLDRLLGVATCLFLVSAIASFASIRRARSRRRLESAAESVFLVALVLVTIAAFNHHTGFPGIGFIELMTGVGDFIEHRHRNGLLPQFSPRCQRGMNASIYRLTVGVQLRNDERTGPRLRCPVLPVSDNIDNRRLRFLNRTLRERG